MNKSGSDSQRLLRLARIGLALAVVIGAFAFVLPAFASYGDIAASLGSLETGWLGLLALAACFNLVAPSTSQVAALPGLSLRRAITADWATTAVTNAVPGGSAFAIGLIWSMYRRWGLQRAAIARSIVVTGVWDTLVKLGTPLLAVAWLAAELPPGQAIEPIIVQAGIVGAVLFVAALVFGAAVLASRGLGQALGRLFNRLPLIGVGWPGRFEELRTGTLELLAARGWALTAWTVVGHANLWLLLGVCLRAVGIGSDQLSWAQILAAFAFGRLVTALPLTPGGIGVLEVGLTGSLLAFGGGVAEADVVAAVFLFRICSYLAPLLLGVAVLATGAVSTGGISELVGVGEAEGEADG